MMAIHDMWSYDHTTQLGTDISSGTTLTAYSETGTYNIQTGLIGMLYKNTSGTGVIGTDGFLTLTTAGGTNPVLLVQAKEVQDWSAATQYWIGFRTKTTSQNGAACNIFAISDSLADTNFQALLQETDMTSASANVANTEYYVEIFIDRSNLLYQVWVNGVKIKNGSLTAAALPSGGNGYYWFGAYNSQSGVTNGATRCFRDFYFLDVDATTPNRLGSIRSALQSVSAVTAPNYTSYDGALIGSAGISSAQGKVSSASLTMNSSTSSLVEIPDRPGLRMSGNWTIEAWCYMTSVASDVQLVEKSLNSTAANRAWIEFNAQQIQVKVDGSASASAIGPSTGVPGANQWFHLAIVQNGSTMTAYVNGASVGTLSNTATWGNQAGNLYIGQSFGLTAPVFPGYIQELRFSSVARYTANFTPATTPFTTDANTTLLMHLSNSTAGLVSDDAVSALTALQQPYSSSTAITQIPAVINAPTDDQISIALATSYVTSKSILAMDFRIAASTPNTPATLTSAISQGGSNTSFGTYTISDSNVNYGRRLGLTTKAPDGGVWTPTKISATTMLLTPTS
jgi:hypothetical protein